MGQIKWEIFQTRNEESFWPMDLYFQGLKEFIESHGIANKFLIALISSPQVKGFCCPSHVWNEVMDNIIKQIKSKDLSFKGVIPEMEHKFNSALNLHTDPSNFQQWIDQVRIIARDQSCICFWASTSILKYMEKELGISNYIVNRLIGQEPSVERKSYSYLIDQLKLIADLLEKRNQLRDKIIKPFENLMPVKLGVDRKKMCFLTTDEILKILTKKDAAPDLSPRERLSVLLVDELGPRVLESEEAEQFAGDIRNLSSYTPEQEVDLVRGQVAAPGCVQGNVRLVLSREDFSKIKPGEILITTMTSPLFVQYIQKAAGIVTDDGGITCHAAIVSRELKIPCIVGTKVATKVFKNGKVIEVDANKGIARKVSANGD